MTEVGPQLRQQGVTRGGVGTSRFHETWWAMAAIARLRATNPPTLRCGVGGSPFDPLLTVRSQHRILPRQRREIPRRLWSSPRSIGSSQRRPVCCPSSRGSSMSALIRIVDNQLRLEKDES